MAIHFDTLRELEARLDALDASCAALLGCLNEEARALARLDLAGLEALAPRKAQALGAVSAADMALREVVGREAAARGIDADLVLKEGPLAAAVATRTDAIRGRREALRRANEAVRARAVHGLAFVRGSRGTPDGYGASGTSRELTPDFSRFHRVL